MLSVALAPPLPPSIRRVAPRCEPEPGRDSRRGIALVWVLVVMLLVVSAILAAQGAGERARTAVSLELEFHGQASNAARAGISDALAWFRRQTTQPVIAFAPRRDIAVVPPVNETDDASIGLVRSWEVSSIAHVHARYEVRAGDVEDLSSLRGVSGGGIVWRFVSRGFVYRQVDAGVPFDQAPNEVIARATASTEIRRMSLVLPAPAAICTSAPSLALFNARTKVMGGAGMGCVYPAGAGLPTVQGTLTGSPPQSAVVPYRGTVAEVFGVTDGELASLADVYTEDPTTLATPLPPYKLTYVNGNVTFNSQRPLEGTGILVVTGHLVVAAASSSVWNGLIYVRDGNFHLNAPCLVRGAVVANSQVQIIGSGDFVEVDYDPDLLADVLQRIGQYRLSKPITLGAS